MKNKQKAIYREVKLEDWGNDKVIKIEKDILKKAGFDVGKDEVLDIEIQPNKISLIRKDQLTPFQKLFVGYHGGKPKAEPLWDEAAPIRKEEW